MNFVHKKVPLCQAVSKPWQPEPGLRKKPRLLVETWFEIESGWGFDTAGYAAAFFEV